MTVEPKRQLREHWPMKFYRLGEEPRDDLLATTSAEERVRMVDVLSRRAWDLTGKPIERTSRAVLTINRIRRP